jgi:hypothetical protein
MMTKDTAETIALQALAWIMGQDDMVGVFLGSTGASLEDLKNNAANPEFLGAVMDFLLMDDAWVIQFAQDMGTPADHVMQARAALPGGQTVHWT